MPITDTSFMHLQAPWNWFSVQDLLSNAFYNWKIHPVLGFLSHGSLLGYCVLLWILNITATSWVARTTGRSTLTGILWGIFNVIFCALTFGINIPILSVVVAVSCTVASILYLQKISSSPKRFAFSLFLGLFIAHLSQEFGPLVLLVGVPLARALKPDSAAHFSTYIFGALILSPLFTAPLLSFPDYPSDARLIPGYGTAYGIDPLISAAPLRPVIDREYTQNALIIPALLLLVTSLVSMRRPATKHLAWIVGIGALCVLLDSSWTPAEIRIMSPIQTLSRIVPGYSFFPLAVFMTAITTAAASFLLTTRAQTLGFVIASFILLGATRPAVHPLFGDLLNPIPPKDKYLESPSLYLLRTEGSKARLSVSGTWEPLTTFEPMLSASHNQNALRAILNDKPRDRWSTKAASQTGSEWIEISFKSPVFIGGIDLSVTRFSSDFPRGIRIKTGTKQGDRCLFEATLFEQERWLGSIFYTPAGYPYYSPESIVRIPFTPLNTECIRIEQIGRSDSFEWSVEGIKILLPS